jgi:hypothetical protein
MYLNTIVLFIQQLFLTMFFFSYILMEKYSQKRSKSSARAKTTPASLTLDQVLKQINPLNKSTIELEDMKRLLLRLPEHIRPTVQQIFHSYIFTTKCFVMQVSEFCRLFDQGSTSRVKNYEESHFRQNLNISREYPKVKEVQSKDVSYCIDNRSVSPDRKPKSNTYVQIYQGKKTSGRKKEETDKSQESRKFDGRERFEKKQVDDRKEKIEKKWTQCTETKETADMSPLQKSVEVFNTNRSFKDCYLNIQELIDIRKAHFQQMALRK